MATGKQIAVGILILLAFASVIYMTLPGQVQLKIQSTKSSFYIWENNSWLLTGTEYNYIYNGTKSLGRQDYIINYSTDKSNITKITRIVNYTKGNIKDTYVFLGNEEDKEKFPISHTIEISGAKGFIYQYIVDGLYYSGNTISVSGKGYTFGKNMRIEWDKIPYYAKINKLSGGKGKLTLKFKIDKDYEIYSIRLFDPGWIGGSQIRYAINITNGDQAGSILRANETINLTLDTNTLVNNGQLWANCSNLYIMYKTQELDRRIINCNNLNSSIEFQLQENISIEDHSNYYLYINGTIGDNEPNLSKIYRYYNEFNTGTTGALPSDWSQVGTSWKICNNYPIIGGKAICANLSDQRFSKNPQYAFPSIPIQIPFKFESMMKYGPAGGGSYSPLLVGLNKSTDVNNLIYIGYDNTPRRVYGKFLAGVSTNIYTSGVPSEDFTNFVIVSAVINGTGANITWINGTDNQDASHLEYFDSVYAAVYGGESAGSVTSYFFDNYTIKMISNNSIINLLAQEILANSHISIDYNNYESGSNVTILANATYANGSLSGSTICLSVGLLNLSCNSSIYTYNWSSFVFKDEFNDSLKIHNISFIGKQNQSVYLEFNETDVIESCYWNMTGFNTNNSYPTNVKIFVNDTLSNEFVSKFNIGTTIINLLNDSTSAKNLSFPNGYGTQYAYIRMPKVSDIPNATMNFTGYNITTQYLNSRAVNNTITGISYVSTNCYYAHDNNWTTPCTQADGSTNLYLNFSVPSLTSKMYINFYHTVIRSAYGTSSLAIYYRNQNNLAWTAFYSSPGLPSPGSQAFNITQELPYNAFYNTSNSSIILTTLETKFSLSGVLPDAPELYYETAIGYYKNYSYNPYVEVGTVDNVLEFNYTGDFNYTEGNTSNINNSFKTYLSSCTADVDGYCDVPIKVVVQNPFEPRTPMVQVHDINITYQFQPNPISLNATQINNFLNLTTSTSNVTFNIQSDTNGTLQISNLYCPYLGSKNMTIVASIYDAGVYSDNISQNISIWYSGFNYTMATQYLEFIPASPTSKNVQPWGQNGSVPILNFTNKANAMNSNLSIYLNETGTCVSLMYSLTNSSSKINMTQGTWNEITNNWGYLKTQSIWLWANYSCNSSSWSLWNPYLSVRNCCQNCFCDTSGV
jgi:hypothetical protein